MFLSLSKCLLVIVLILASFEKPLLYGITCINGYPASKSKLPVGFFKKPGKFINSKYENADLEYYYEAVKNWADSNGAKKKDWAATARGFMLRDLKDDKLKLKNGVAKITNEDREFEQWVADHLND